ncbi:MAG: iron chelate uptake ABC transporter family permease subunit, partial [Proteobacteria bacterium]|nr:iron chelate uptake ABC transporter family permease subunit [Pseudomonadota bacterium]
IAFIGLAVPHITRLVINTSDHKKLLPAVAAMGVILMLICDILSQVPGREEVLPINIVTSLVGAPVVIWIIMRKKVVKTSSVHDLGGLEKGADGQSSTYVSSLSVGVLGFSLFLLPVVHWLALGPHIPEGTFFLISCLDGISTGSDSSNIIYSFARPPVYEILGWIYSSPRAFLLTGFLFHGLRERWRSRYLPYQWLGFLY